MNKPALELSRGKVAARLVREGWVVRHGGAHDVFYPSGPSRAHHYAATPPQAVARRRTQYRQGGGMDLRGDIPCPGT
jgi:hypothetical protein